MITGHVQARILPGDPSFSLFEQRPNACLAAVDSSLCHVEKMYMYMYRYWKSFGQIVDKIATT
jgi:hypothetical protein